MLCPKDAVATVQHKGEGDTVSTDNKYTSWRIEVCPVCGLKMLEFYSATVLVDPEVEIKSEQNALEVIRSTS